MNLPLPVGVVRLPGYACPHLSADLERLSLETLSQRFGKAGEFYYSNVRGQDDRPQGVRLYPDAEGEICRR
jgi:hypothetical protein